MSNLKQTISNYLNKLQQSLFPYLKDHLETPITKTLQEFIIALDMVEIEKFVYDHRGDVGRPPKNRAAVARAFVAKSWYNISDTKSLIERLKCDKNLRKICGFETVYSIPGESSFSRAFKSFTDLKLPQRAHVDLIVTSHKDEIIGHLSIDSTAIEAREKPVKKEKAEDSEEKNVPKTPKKRAAKGCAEKTRIEKQASGEMTLEEMINDLPTDCNIGRKTSSSGHPYVWIGYKYHLAIGDHGIPIAAMLTSASMNDSQAAIPLSIIAKQRVESFYTLMDGSYYANGIIEHVKSQNQVPIIDTAPKGEVQKAEKDQENLARKTLNWEPADATRYYARTSVERANSRIKDEFGARTVRVKGADKVSTHLMFGILVLTADCLIRLAT